MFLILLRIATCDKLCLKASSGDGCPESVATASRFATAALLIAAVKNPGTIIYLAADVSSSDKFTDAQIKFITEIISVKSDNSIAAVNYEIASEYSIDSLNLTSVTLTATASSASHKLRAEGKLLTCKLLTLNSGSKVGAAGDISINKLVTDALTPAEDAIALTKEEITIFGENSVITISANDKTVKLTGGQTGDSEITLPEITKLNINSTVTTKTVDFTVSGAFAALTAVVNVNLIYGNTGESIITLKSADSTTTSTKLKINVNTYYKEGDKFNLISSMLDLNQDYKINTDGNRKVPASSQYCIDKDFGRDEKCKPDAQVLWKNTELAGMSNGDSPITLYVSGYTAAADFLTLNLNDYKAKSIKFSSVDPDNSQQNIKFTFANKDEKVTGRLDFDNIKITAVLPASSTDGSLEFSKLFVRKTKIVIGGAASKNLKANKVTVKANDLTADSASLSNIEFSTPAKLSLIDAKTASFKGDGSQVTIDSTLTLTKEKVPKDFVFVVLDEQTKTATFTIEENDEKPGTALPFAIDIQAGGKLEATYSGDWSANNIVVNVADKASFIGKKGNDPKDSSPSMEYTGTGTASLDGNPMKKVEQPAGPTATPKGGLSGGAIAGIVIACVVIVAAVVVVVVVVIKKKKGKVTN